MFEIYSKSVYTSDIQQQEMYVCVYESYTAIGHWKIGIFVPCVRVQILKVEM